MTREHNVLRLRWMLKDGGSEPVYSFLAASRRRWRDRAEERKEILAAIKSGKYARRMAKLSERERGTGGGRRERSGRDAGGDSRFESGRRLDVSLRRNGARFEGRAASGRWNFGCSATVNSGDGRREDVRDRVGRERRSALTDWDSRDWPGRSKRAAKKAVYRAARRIDERLRGRDPGAVSPLFVGLLNANSQGGVFVNSAPLSQLSRYRAAMSCWIIWREFVRGPRRARSVHEDLGAGLAYSNGIECSR